MGTGYTRADVSNNIADGNIINASDLDSEFDAVQAAFDAATGHTHDGTTGEGAPIEVTGPAQEYVSTNTEFRPKANNTYDLGSTGNQWKNLYVDGTANLDAVDIDGGNIDGTVIGAASAAAGTFTTATATTGNITTVNATTVDTTNIEVTNIKAKDGTAAGSIADATGVVTLASSVLTTTDINGGTIDNTTIATSDVTVGAGKTLNVSAGTLTLANDQISGDKVEGGTINAITINTLGSTTGNITTVNATTVDSTNVEVTNLKAKDGTASATIANSTGVMTVASSVLTTTDINGGTIDGTTIGGASAAAGTFTNVTANGTINLAGATVSNGGAVTTIDINGGTIDGTVIGGSTPAAISGTTGSFSGDVSIADKIVHTGDTDTAIRFPAADTVTVETAGTERLRVDATGSVQLGSSTGVSPTLFVYDNDTTDAAIIVRQDGSAPVQIWQGAGAGELMRITSTGNVGIGTSSPNNKLIVNGGMGTIGEAAAALTTGVLIDQTASTLGRILSYSATSSGLAFYTGTSSSASERMRIDSSGNLLVGTTTANFSAAGRGNINVNGSSDALIALSKGFSSTTAAYFYFDGTDAEVRNINNGALKLSTNNTERMRITSTGNVGIGTSSPARILHVAGSGSGSGDGAYLHLTTDGTGHTSTDGSTIEVRRSDDALRIANLETNGITVFETAGLEAMRIDLNQNLLVGKTSTDLNVDGSRIGGFGAILTRSGNEPLRINRRTSDGDIVKFDKDGTTVGSIGTVGDQLFIVGGDTGLQCNGTSDQLRPCGSTGSARDNVIDLGNATARFNDIYAGNGTIQTSDRNEKQDIEALSEAEQRVAVACKGLLRKFRWKSSVEEKGDDARIHFGIIAQDLQAAFAAEGLDAGRYAMFIHSTWVDEETGEERSRMGVRYPQLLAFIIAAI